MYFMTFYDLLRPVLIGNVSMSRWFADIKLDSCLQFIFNAGITFFSSMPGLQEAIHVVASNFCHCLNGANGCEMCQRMGMKLMHLSTLPRHDSKDLSASADRRLHFIGPVSSLPIPTQWRIRECGLGGPKYNQEIIGEGRRKEVKRWCSTHQVIDSGV